MTIKGNDKKEKNKQRAMIERKKDKETNDKKGDSRGEIKKCS